MKASAELIFNEMRERYDDLRDLWYAWLSSRLHYFIAREVLAHWETWPRDVLDVGCGTGFQSFLYALTGAAVFGVDISDQLIFAATAKARGFKKEFPCSLFPAHFDFVDRYDILIGSILRQRFSEAILIRPRFRTADARKLPFADELFDHVNCCGSTLSFIPDHMRALMEMSRVLMPGGTFILEVESKYNLDRIWTALDTPNGLQILFSKVHQHVVVDSAWATPIMHQPVETALKLFSKGQLIRELESVGLKVTRVLSMHSVTNLLPSSVLDQSDPGARLRRVFAFLAAIEERVPFYLPGCSLVLLGQKT